MRPCTKQGDGGRPVAGGGREVEADGARWSELEAGAAAGGVGWRP